MATTAAPIAGTPLSLKPQIPITPPPDCLSFQSKHSQYPPRGEETVAKEAMTQAAVVQTQTAKDARAEEACRCHADSNAPTPTTVPQPLPTAAGQLDPRQIAMVSRIAAYYQQRCQAISNYQHQKCQAWANMQRQKCQEMTQAALLVVAWYVRDRIQRRRKRQKRQFRRALTERAGVSGKVKKVDSVSKWASRIPADALPPDDIVAKDNRPVDKEELEFTMDAEPTPPDSDSKLFAVADNMIKSQLAKIDMPLMGAISFSEDEESESESDYEEMHRWRPDPEAPARDEDGEAQEEEDDDDDDYSYDDDEDMEEYTGDDGSERVHKGTGNNTRKGGASSISS